MSAQGIALGFVGRLKQSPERGRPYTRIAG
jgi:hypothetical protein